MKPTRKPFSDFASIWDMAERQVDPWDREPDLTDAAATTGDTTTDAPGEFSSPGRPAHLDLSTICIAHMNSSEKDQNAIPEPDIKLNFRASGYDFSSLWEEAERQVDPWDREPDLTDAAATTTGDTTTDAPGEFSSPGRPARLDPELANSGYRLGNRAALRGDMQEAARWFEAAAEVSHVGAAWRRAWVALELSAQEDHVGLGPEGRETLDTLGQAARRPLGPGGETWDVWLWLLFADNLGNPLAKFIVQATRSAEGAARKAGDLAAWELLEISLRNKASQMLKESLRVAQKDRIAVFDSDIMARFATFSRKVFDSKQHHPTRGLLASPNEDPKHVDFGPSEAFKEWQRFVDTILIRFGKVSSHPYRVNDEIPARPKSSDWDWRQSEVAANPSGCKKLRLGGHEVDLVVRRWFERADAILPVDFIWWPARVVDWSADLGRGVLAVFDLCSSSNVLLKCHFEGSHGRPFRPGQELELGMKKVAGRDSCEAVLIDM